MAFCDNLYYLRKRENISQEELADRLNVTRQAVSKWETGDAYPETEKIISLCDMFGVTMDELLRGDVTNEKTGGNMPEPTPVQPDFKEEHSQQNQPVQTEETEQNTHKTATAAAQGILWLVVSVIYVILGIFGDLWHPGWIIFVYTPALSAGIEFAFASKKRRAKKLKDFVDSIAIFGATGTYLLCGFFLGMWHPLWILFLIIPITCAITEAVYKAKK